MRCASFLSLLAVVSVAAGADETLPSLDSLDLAPARREAPKKAPAPISSGPGSLAPLPHGTYNEEVLAAVQAMPTGGGYASSSQAMAGLAQAIRIDKANHLLLRPDLAQPAFCSGATYLVFLSALDRLQHEGRVELSADVLEALQMRRQADGAGLWGRWNANGPGTAKLFHDLGLGRNFTSFQEAQPGDFLKVWWNDEVGVKEHGHSVVYLGSTAQDGAPAVAFWSANLPGGFGRKTVAMAKIHRVLFSRLQRPQAIEQAPTLPARDPYLAEMLRRGSPDEELSKMVGLPPGEAGRIGEVEPKRRATAPTGERRSESRSRGTASQPK